MSILFDRMTVIMYRVAVRVTVLAFSISVAVYYTIFPVALNIAELLLERKDRGMIGQHFIFETQHPLSELQEFSSSPGKPTCSGGSTYSRYKAYQRHANLTK